MKSILILEDDENLRELLVDVLDSLDYQVEGASCAEEALHVAEEIAFEVVISDVRMAGPVDGLGALEQMKRKRPSLACIVMTGYADEMAPLRAMQIRVDDYLYKPFDIKDIQAALERVRKSANQNQWHRRALSRLLGHPAPQEVLVEVQHIREEALKGFFVALRSGLLYAETALDAWDQLEELESAYVSLLRLPSNLNLDSVVQAKSRYQNWLLRLAKKAADKEFVSATQRSAEKVDRATFKRFTERIRSARVSAEDLALAVTLRRISPERRTLEDEELWQRMWGA